MNMIVRFIQFKTVSFNLKFFGKQLISNDKFKSVEHRVLARSIGTRVSSACFFYPSSDQILKPYGPLKELETPPVYREVSYLEFVTCHQKKLSEGTSTLLHFKI